MAVLTKTGFRRYAPRLKPCLGWPPMIALLDIGLLIVMFLFISKSFIKVYGVKVDLPVVGTAAPADLEKYIVTIVPVGGGSGVELYYQDSRIGMDQLPQALSRLHDVSRNAAIIIRSDRNVSFEAVAQVMTIAEKAGVPSFLAVSVSGEKSAAKLE